MIHVTERFTVQVVTAGGAIASATFDADLTRSQNGWGVSNHHNNDRAIGKLVIEALSARARAIPPPESQ